MVVNKLTKTLLFSKKEIYFIKLTGVQYTMPIEKPRIATPAAIFHWLSRGNWSLMILMITLQKATVVPIPSTKSIKKKSTAKSCGTTVNFAKASG